jgi:hypothetical protein
LAVAHGEGLGQAVIERKIVLGIEADGLILGGILAIIFLLSRVVLADEAVA